MDASSTAPSTAVTAYTEAWLAGYDGTNFYTRTYLASAPRALLLFVHGFVDHVGRYEESHLVHASKGITVFTYDQRGFGRTALDKINKSKASSYGKTNWHQQLSDIEWWLKHIKKQYPELPLFLMGHSMGGGLVSAFNTRSSAPPAKETLSLLSGTIVSSPLLLLTIPVSRLIRFIGGKTSAILPNLRIPAPVSSEDVSHDAVYNKTCLTDPLLIQQGTLKGLHDMFSGGEQLLWNDYKFWQRTLPLLMLHGDADRVTSHKAAKEFFDKLDVEDKTFRMFEGGFHELVHEPGMKEEYVDECISWILKRAGRRNGPDMVATASRL